MHSRDMIMHNFMMGVILLGVFAVFALLIASLINTVGQPYEIISQPYKISYQECEASVEVPVGENSTMEVCVYWVTVYEVKQDILIKGRWWDQASSRSLGRVDKDYQVSFNYSLEDAKL